MPTLPEDRTIWSVPADAERCVSWLRRLLCLFTLLLMGSTHELWVPQRVFPQVPLLYLAGALPDFLQWGWVALAVVGLLVAFVDRAAGRYWRAGLGTLAGSMTMLWLFDQHRLQPWAYQAVLIALVLSTVDARRAIRLVRLLTISIYIYSAISKLDYTFLHSLGQHFTQALLQLVGASSENWTDSQRVFAALLFPLGELAVALLLAIPTTRRIGMWAAVVMHTLLLLVLGPFGLNHQPAVLMWNVEFIVFAWLLFGSQRVLPSAVQAEEKSAPSKSTWPARLATGILIVAFGAPLLEPFGYCDHWLAWGLYSPGASRAQVFVQARDVDALPSDWHQFITPGAEDATWLRLRIDLWSLQDLRAPIYPQARFQLGVALAVANALPANHDVRVELSSAANRFTGERELTSLQTRPQLEEVARAYWVNAFPAE